MSQAELKTDQTATYEALNRKIEAGQTTGQAFRKLVERLAWVNAELAKTRADA